MSHLISHWTIWKLLVEEIKIFIEIHMYVESCE